MRRLVGIGYRFPLADWVATRPPEIGCLEITAEHFFSGNKKLLAELARDYPTFVHGLGLSLGTPGPLDERTLAQFAEVVEICKPQWISEHIAFTRSAEVDLGHLNPIAPTQKMLDVIAEHATQLSERCKRPLILENITSHLPLKGEMSEPEFLNRLCEKAKCGLLLDVTNLFINSRNHKFDARKWLHELEPRNIVQLHAVGYTEIDGRFEDHHSTPMQSEILELVGDVVEYAPVKAIIVERDAKFPPPAELARELRALGALCEAA